METIKPNEDTPIEISTATLNDVRAISEVQKASWLATYPNEEYGITKEDILSEDFFSNERIEKRTEIIGNPKSNTRFFVAKIDGRVVGYCCARRDGGLNIIRSIYILPEFQGVGIGQKFMSAAFDFLDKSLPTRLTVAIYNDKAIKFYEKSGFKKGELLENNPEGHFVSGREIPEMEMVREPDNK